MVDFLDISVYEFFKLDQNGAWTIGIGKQLFEAGLKMDDRGSQVCLARKINCFYYSF